MKKRVIILGVIGLIGCSGNQDKNQSNVSSEQIPNNEILQNQKPQYKLIRDNLYFDNEGNIYLKTIDRSSADSGSPEKNKALTYDRWLYVAYCDTCTLIYPDETIEGLTELKNIVDTATFKLEFTDNKQGADIYEDKNYRYFHKWMADGGTITLMEK